MELLFANCISMTFLSLQILFYSTILSFSPGQNFEPYAADQGKALLSNDPFYDNLTMLVTLF